MYHFNNSEVKSHSDFVIMWPCDYVTLWLPPSVVLALHGPYSSLQHWKLAVQNRWSKSLRMGISSLNAFSSIGLLSSWDPTLCIILVEENAFREEIPILSSFLIIDSAPASFSMPAKMNMVPWRASTTDEGVTKSHSHKVTLSQSHYDFDFWIIKIGTFAKIIIMSFRFSGLLVKLKLFLPIFLGIIIAVSILSLLSLRLSKGRSGIRLATTATGKVQTITKMFRPGTGS